MIGKVLAMSDLIVNFDFVGSCRGSCPSCTLSEFEREQPVSFMTGGQMKMALSMAVGSQRPDFLAVGVGRGNNLALEHSEHSHIFDLTAHMAKVAPQARRVMEISTSLVEAPAKQRENAIRLADGCAQSDPAGEARFVVVLDVSKTSSGYWTAIESFMRWMHEHRGGEDGQGDILSLNLSVKHLPNPSDVYRRVSYWRGPVNVQWLAYGQGAVSPDDLLAGQAWIARFADLADRGGLDCNLLNVGRLATSHAGVSPIEAIKSQNRRLIWVDRTGAVRPGVFTMVGDYIIENANIPVRALSTMMRNTTCSSCAKIGACIQAGGYAPAFEVLKVMGSSGLACPALVRDCLESDLMGTTNV